MRLGDVRLRLADIRFQVGGVLLDDDLAGPDDLALAEVDGEDAPGRAGRELHIWKRLDVAGDGDGGGDRAALHGRDLDRDAAAGVADAGLALARPVSCRSPRRPAPRARSMPASAEAARLVVMLVIFRHLSALPGRG